MNLTEQQQQQAQQMLNAFISKCWEDESFKQEFIANPKATMETFVGRPINLPEGKQLVVNDQSNSNYVYLNIPSEPNLDELELTEEQLEMVAGGVIPIGVAIFYIATSTAAGVTVGRAIGDIFN